MTSRPWLLALLLLPGLALAGPKKKVNKNKKPAPAPAAQEAADSAPTEAMEVWEAMVSKSAAHDPTVFGLYASDAVMKVTRVRRSGEEEVRNWAVGMLVPMAETIMTTGKMLDDRAEYRELEVTPYGDNWKFSASLYSTMKCTNDPDYSAVIGKDGNGNWKILEERQTSWEAIMCEPDPERAKTIISRLYGEAIKAKGQVQKDTVRLDDLTKEDLRLTYKMTLVQVPSTMEGLDEYTVGLPDAVRLQVCGIPASKVILHHGGAIKYVYSTSDGKALYEAEFTGEACE